MACLFPIHFCELHCTPSPQEAQRVTLTMQEMEKIIGDSLPASAYRYSAWWGNSATMEHPYSRAWTDAGYYTTEVSRTICDAKIVFEKKP